MERHQPTNVLYTTTRRGQTRCPSVETPGACMNQLSWSPLYHQRVVIPSAQIWQRALSRQIRTIDKPSALISVMAKNYLGTPRRRVTSILTGYP